MPILLGTLFLSILTCYFQDIVSLEALIPNWNNPTNVGTVLTATVQLDSAIIATFHNEVSLLPHTELTLPLPLLGFLIPFCVPLPLTVYINGDSVSGRNIKIGPLPD